MKKQITLPIPKVKKRKINESIKKEALLLGATELQSNIVASREIPSGTNLKGILNPSLKHIPDVSLLKNIDKAADRISDAIINKEIIGLLCDFDVDGISSTAVLSKSLIDYFNVQPFLIKYFISNRMTEGYGFSSNVLERIFETDDIPTLLITADQGSSDEERVALYLDTMHKKGEKNASVVVTDHHEIPESGGPSSAYAFVNPQQEGDSFPDKTICGCTVALFVMVATRLCLIEKGYLKDDSPKLGELLSYSTAATIADCVSMASEVNRAIVKYGLNEINQEKLPPWKVMRKAIIKNESQPVRADTIGFGLGPRINACSRTGGDGLNGVRFYLSETDISAQRYFDMLDYDNEERKQIEKKLVEKSFEIASDLVLKGHLSLVIYLPDGHHGIHGIVASRVVEKFGRPTICLSPRKVNEEIYQEDHLQKIEEVEKNIEKNFETMVQLRSTFRNPKNTTTEYVINKKENYKELKGKDRIESIYLRKKVFTKEDVKNFLYNKYNINIGKNIQNFYYLNNNNYIKIDKKSKDNYIIKIGTIEIVSGSARSVDGLETAKQKKSFNLHHALVNISKQDKDMFLGFGGHTMAAGMSLQADKINDLAELFEKEVSLELSNNDVGPKIFIDGELPYDDINLDLVNEIQFLEPYGRSFDYPTFSITGYVKSIQMIGESGDTAKLIINFNNKEYSAIWFKFISNPMYGKIKNNSRCRMVISITDNYFQNQRKPSLQIIHALPY